jgi:NitT/TauT family transport system permease protein
MSAWSSRLKKIAPPLAVIAFLIAGWWIVVVETESAIFPTPAQVLAGAWELAKDGTLWDHIGASLFRFGVGFGLALVVAIPLGLGMGWIGGAFRTLNPIFQMLRPISPIAWIPLAILWFGVGDVSAIFLIFLASLLPLTVATMNAVHNIDPVHLAAARNFDIPLRSRVTDVLVPAILPQLIVAMRIALGVAWLVVVAAEMIAVNSGLGFLIVDARNAGNRYDLVIAGMVLIGAIGVVLDLLMRRLERLDSVRWGYATE